MNARSTSPRSRRPALRWASAILPAAALGASALLAPRAAHAQEAELVEWAADNVAQDLLGDGVNGLLGLNGSGSSLTLTQVQSAIDSALGSQEMATAKTAADDALTVMATFTPATTDAVIMGQGNGSIAQATTIYTDADDTINDISNLSASLQYQLASTYVTMALLSVSFRHEAWQLCVEDAAQGGACTPGSYSPLSYKAAQKYLPTIMGFYKTFEAQFPANASSSFGLRDGGSITNDLLMTSGAMSESACGKGDDGDYCHDNSNTGSLNYCVTYTPYGGSGQVACPTTDLSTASYDVSGPGSFTASRLDKCGASGHYGWYDTSTTDGPYALANARAWYTSFKSYQRDQQLGSMFFEAVATLQKAAAGDVSYCGDGVCNLAESHPVGCSSSSSCSFAPVCPADCSYVGTGVGVTSEAGSENQFAILPYGTVTYSASSGLHVPGNATYTTSQAQTLLKTSEAYLSWQSTGNLVLYSSANAVLWQTGAYGSSASLELLSTGALEVVGSSTWSSGTVPSSTQVDGTTRLPCYVVLVGEVLYIVDDQWSIWWESDLDSHAYADVTTPLLNFASQVTLGPTSPRFCTAYGGMETLLAATQWNQLWFISGELVVKDLTTGTSTWTAGGSSPVSGSYLCNDETGNLSLYDAKFNVLWTSGGGGGTPLQDSFAGWGGGLVLSGTQLQALAPSGEPTWTSTTCSGNNSWACSTGATTVSAAVAIPVGGSSSKWQTSGVTVLSNDYASFVFNGLSISISDQTAVTEGGSADAATIWSKSISTSGTPTLELALGDQLFYGGVSGGTLNAKWMEGSMSTSAGHLILAGCTLSLLDSGDNAVWSSQTACSYGAYNDNLWFASVPN